MRRAWLIAEVVFFAFATSSGWKLWRVENAYASTHPHAGGLAHGLAFVGLAMVVLSIGAIVVALRFIQREGRASHPSEDRRPVAKESAGQAA